MLAGPLEPPGLLALAFPAALLCAAPQAVVRASPPSALSTQDRVCSDCAPGTVPNGAGASTLAQAKALLPFMGFETRASSIAEAAVREQASRRIELECRRLDGDDAAAAAAAAATGAAPAQSEERKAWQRAWEELLGEDPAWGGLDAEYPVFVRELYSEDGEMVIEEAVQEMVKGEMNVTKAVIAASKRAGARLGELVEAEGFVPRGASGLLRRTRTLGLFQLIDGVPVLHCVVISVECRPRPGLADNAQERFMCARDICIFEVSRTLVSLHDHLRPPLKTSSTCAHSSQHPNRNRQVHLLPGLCRQLRQFWRNYLQRPDRGGRGGRQERPHKAPGNAISGARRRRPENRTAGCVVGRRRLLSLVVPERCRCAFAPLGVSR